MTTATVRTERTGTAVLAEVAAAAILQYVLSRVLAKAVTAGTERETQELAGR